MYAIRGLFRFTVAILAILIATPIIIILSLMPAITYQKTPAAAWSVTLTCRFILWLLDVHITCPNLDKIRNHHGLIFPNHVSFLDAFIVMGIAPMRFLAKEEVSRWFVIGLIGKAIGCVFVNRGDKASRQRARQTLEKIPMPPPLVIFPEGKIGHVSGILYPFRYGAFDIAIQSRRPYLLCPILYGKSEKIVHWGDEPLFACIWRVVSHPQPFHIPIVPMDIIQPQPTDNPETLATQAYADFLAALQYPQPAP